MVRAVTETVFIDDPLRLLRAVRLEDELGLPHGRAHRRSAARVVLARHPAGRRTRARRAPAPVSGRLSSTRRGRSARATRWLARRIRSRRWTIRSSGWSPCSVGGSGTLPISRELRRYAAALLHARRPEDDSPRAIHRFRRATEPWALDALAFLGATELSGAVERARRSGSVRAARARRRARSASWTRDRTYPRDHRRGARSRNDLHAGAGPRARPFSRGSGVGMSVRLRLALQEQRAAELGERMRRLLGPFTGTEVALDAGSGTGSLALALAPHVGEVVAVDTRTRLPRRWTRARTCERPLRRGRHDGAAVRVRDVRHRGLSPRAPSRAPTGAGGLRARAGHAARRPGLRRRPARIGRSPAEPRDGSIRATPRSDRISDFFRTPTSTGSSTRTISCSSRRR